jgi:hypothetical protein
MERWMVEKVCDKQADVQCGAEDLSDAKKFVLHRHRDDAGEHLDLRLEEGDVLVGWRMPADALEHLRCGEPVACELKRVHPKRWLGVEDGECVVEDSGRYRWLGKGVDGGTAVFNGGHLAGSYRFTRQEQGSEPVVDRYERSVSVINQELGLDLARTDDTEELVALARDGNTARKRAVERLCALGGQLDGDSFDEHMWRKTLRHLSLREIHAHLRSFERRFDEKHPPVPVTKRECLDSDNRQRERAAAGILSEELSLRE